MNRCKSHEHCFTQPLAYVSGRWLPITFLLLRTLSISIRTTFAERGMW
jgi:hypothetical protein